MKKIMIVFLLVSALMLMAVKPAFAGGEPYVGEITIFAGTYAPRGYAFCDGRLFFIRDNTALFSILGTTYGGDGKMSFALPDLRKAERFLGGARYIIALEGLYPPRQ